MSDAGPGYLLIADITGYTRFLTSSELEHARGILEELFAALLTKLNSPFRLSNVQGDAILAHARAAHVADGSHVLDIVENMYAGFADKLEFMVRNTTCTCNACRNMPGLDLKLFVHYGPYVEQSIGGRNELSGPDVILIHRLLKNSIVEATGVRAYAAFTEAAVAAIALPEFFGRAPRHREDIDPFGAVALRIVDLRPAWEALKARRSVTVSEQERMFDDVSAELAVPPDRAWHYLTDPALRGAWVDDVVKLTRTRADRGRATVGTVDHCAHGDGKVLTFTILDWRPHEHVSYQLRLPLGGQAPFTIFLAPAPRGCRVTARLGLPVAPDPIRQAIVRFMARRMAPKLREQWVRSLAKLAELARHDAEAGRVGAAVAAPADEVLKGAVVARLAAT
jgi:uncharacterized protein YndB with AHSA1/START domain